MSKAFNPVLTAFACAPLWWLAGIDFIIYPLLIWFAFRLSDYRKMDVFGFSLIALIAVFFFSLGFAALGNAPSDRLFAAA